MKQYIDCIITTVPVAFYWARSDDTLLVRMRRNGQNSTSGQIFNPKFETPMGCFLFEYEIWWGFRQDLYVLWAKNVFCNAKFSEFRG